jgi:hypothetical protein
MMETASCCDETAEAEEAHRMLSESIEEEEGSEKKQDAAEVEHGPVYLWKDLTSIHALLGHDLMTSSHGHNYSYFSNYDSISLLELYLNKVTHSHRILSSAPAVSHSSTIHNDASKFTIQTIAFTFNNKEMTIIEK